MAYHRKENTKYSVRKKIQTKIRQRPVAAARNTLNICTQYTQIILQILNQNAFFFFLNHISCCKANLFILFHCTRNNTYKRSRNLGVGVRVGVMLQCIFRFSASVLSRCIVMHDLKASAIKVTRQPA